MSNKDQFKRYCPEAYARAKDIAHYADDVKVKFKDNCIKLSAIDPDNTEGELSIKLEYGPQIEDEMLACISDIHQRLRTIYRPHYLGFLPVIRAELGRIIKDLECGEVVILEYHHGVSNNGETTATFGYNIDDFERFVEVISELLVSTHAILEVPEDEQPCKDKSHCCNCGNHDCHNAPSQIQTIWQGMTETEQKAFLASLDPETLKQVQYHIDLTKKPNA